MNKMRKGATFIEYALLAGLVAIVVAAAAMFFGQDLKELFGSTGNQTHKVADQVDKVKLELKTDKSGGDSQQAQEQK